MIVRAASEHLLLITQPDHAQLAGRIMEHCVALAHHPRRKPILTAVREHDNGWSEVDAAPIVRDGGVVDFMTLPDAARQEVWPRGVARVSTDPYVAALVAQHAMTAYARLRTDSGWTSFFAEMETLRNEHLRKSGLPHAELEADYPFVRLGDVISLAFCTGSNALQVAPWRVDVSGSRVVVAPDLFGGVTVNIEIRARQLATRQFSSDDELRGALAVAEWTELHAEVAGP
jgi:hypothetical protein